MRDLIDRAVAIDMANDMYQGLNIVQASYSDIGRALVKFLNLVPSAQPTQPNTPNTLESLDCISRQAAIDAAKEELDSGTFYDIPSKIESLPSAQPESTILKAIEKIKEVGCDEIIFMPKHGMKAWDENGVEYTMTPSAQPEIIRCKDCKHYEFADNRAFGMPVKYCDWFGFEDVDDYDFCSRAERRTDE